MDSGTGNNARIIFNPITTGNYFLASTSFPDDGFVGTYSLSIVQVQDVSNDINTTGRISVGGSVNSDHFSGDFQDWFGVSLLSGVTYDIDLEGVSTSAGTMMDPDLAIYDGAGNFLLRDTDAGVGSNARLVFTPSAGGTYYLSSASAEENGFSTGTYKLSIDERAGNPAAGNDIGIVLSGSSLELNVGANDTDPSGGGLTTSILSSPTRGIASVSERASGDLITFSAFSFATPGVEDIRYSITDDRGVTDTGIARILVTASSDLPHYGFLGVSAPTTVMNPGESLISFLGDGTAEEIFSSELTELRYDFNSDEDHIQLALEAGSTYEIRVSNNSDSDYQGFTSFATREIEGENVSIPNAFNLAGDSVVSFTATTTGNHNLLIAGFNIDHDDYGGTYEVNLVETLPTAETIISDGVYRFFNDTNGVHFYSASFTERQAIVDSLPNFTLEGPAFRAADPTKGSTINVSRFYNTDTGAHLFTTSFLERQIIIDTIPEYNFEGIVYDAYQDQVAGSTPVYRFFNTTSGTHFFTASLPEAQSVADNLPMFDYEGIAYYVETSGGEPFFGEPVIPVRPDPVIELPTSPTPGVDTINPDLPVFSPPILDEGAA